MKTLSFLLMGMLAFGQQGPPTNGVFHNEAASSEYPIVPIHMRGMESGKDSQIRLKKSGEQAMNRYIEEHCRVYVMAGGSLANYEARKDGTLTTGRIKCDVEPPKDKP